MRMTSSINIRSRLVNLRVYRKRRRINRLVSNHNIAILIDENQIAHTDLAEMLRQRIEPEVICEDGVADADVACDAFVETALGEDAVGCC